MLNPSKLFLNNFGQSNLENNLDVNKKHQNKK